MLVALLACSSPTAPAPAAPSGPPPALVQVAEATSGEIADRWSVLGEVRALERAELASGAAGAVARVVAREGDSVSAGQLLVEVDPGLASAELDAGRAEVARLQVELDQAKRTLERVGRVASGVLAANEVDEARTRVASLEASLQGARAAERLASERLGRHRVRAPFPGVVARRHVDPGDWVQVGTPVLDVVRADAVEVRVDAPLELAMHVVPGDRVELGSGEGTVVGVVPALDPVSRTSVVRIEPGSMDGLVAGSSVDVGFDVRMSDGVIVPRDAVVAGPTSSRVFVVQEGVARAVPVETMARTADQVLVRAEGLKAGDVLVVRGNERLRPDQAVTVAP
ncbi:MAG: efflux RND transporter periplasmic adaptor subunit [Alphaproteobacteria bacterium]|nr:efflux RND transporter periplasmic adaptor subunit [Alphaproteobacteria bacterium]MCB9693587.1 efflux RND transporter periplasmic adaptor subunit [Alphaproteobacteria bacterium]